MDALDQYRNRNELMSMLRQRLSNPPPQPGGYVGGPTGSPPGTVPTMLGQTATAEGQQAFTNRNVARAEYGRTWQGGGFPQYAGGIKDRMMEAEKQKAQLELRRNALKDKQSAEKHQLEIAKSAREQEKHDLEKSGQWGGLAGGEGKDTTLQTSGTPLTKGVPDKMKTLPPAGATPNPQTLPFQGEAVQAAPLNQIPTQTAPSPFPPETGSFSTPGGRIVVPEESAKNDPMLKAGTWLMNDKGNTKRIYGQPKPSLGDDPFAYTPNVPRPTSVTANAPVVRHPGANPEGPYAREPMPPRPRVEGTSSALRGTKKKADGDFWPNLDTSIGEMSSKHKQLFYEKGVNPFVDALTDIGKRARDAFYYRNGGGF